MPQAKKPKGFRRTFLDEAKSAFDHGKISRPQLRQCRFVAWFRPNLMVQIQLRIRNCAIEEGELDAKLAGETPLSQIDWEALAAFIRELITWILELIEALKQDPSLAVDDQESAAALEPIPEVGSLASAA